MEQDNSNTYKQAKEELEAICKKHDIVLLPVIVHQGDRTYSSIEIAPRSSFQPQQPQVEAEPSKE